MEMIEFSEAAINVTLASLLCERGLLAGGEVIARRGRQVRKPDVLVSLQGFQIILEGKKHAKNARALLVTQCEKRITDDLCDISIGVVYHLPQVNESLFGDPKGNSLKKALEVAQFDIAVWGAGKLHPPLLQDWTAKDLNGLAELIRDAVHEAHSTDVLAEAIDQIRGTLDAASILLLTKTSANFQDLANKLAPKLELPNPKNQIECSRTIKMAFLVLLDAAIFYNTLRSRPQLPSIQDLKDEHSSYTAGFRYAFNKALDINYAAVFEIALDLLNPLPPEADSAVEKISETAFSIARNRVLLKHDLMGRIYHTLLFKELAKHLATYYTAVTSAWLLAGLAISTPGSELSDIDMSDLSEVGKLKISDFACGSGTLLSAAYQELDRLHTEAIYRNDTDLDRNALHTVLLDKVISGFDVMLYAAHIATVTLAMHNPDSTFDEGHIYVLPFGDRKKSTGSIELMVRESLRARTTAERYDIKGRAQVEINPELASYDLLIMNPPFARSCGDNLLFGSVTQGNRRRQMQERLSSILREVDFTGVGHAGLGAIFVVLAHKFVKPGGRIAFVLPRNLLSGVSWTKIRKLLTGFIGDSEQQDGGYYLEYVMLSTEPGSYNFSENTDLSECMFVARKLKNDEKPGRTVVALMSQKPKTVFEARALGDVLQKYHLNGESSDSFDILMNPSAADGPLQIGNTPMGRAYTLSPILLEENVDNWGRLCAFAVPELTRIAYRLRTMGEFAVTGGISIKIPLKPVAEMFEVGRDTRQIHSAFELSDTGAYDALWGRETGMNTLSIQPNAKLAQRPGVDVDALVRTASNLLITERVRLDTTPLVSVVCTTPVLSNVWWTLLPAISVDNGDETIRIMALWLNSTPALLLHIAEMQVTEGAWARIKKAPLKSLPALDLGKLDEEQIKSFHELYETLSHKQVPVLAQQFAQAAEGQGWRWQLDSNLLEILSGEEVKLRDLQPLYNLLIQEAKHW